MQERVLNIEQFFIITALNIMLRLLCGSFYLKSGFSNIDFNFGSKFLCHIGTGDITYASTTSSLKLNKLYRF